MVDKYASESKLSPLLNRILILLAELNQTRQGNVFYNHIKQTLLDWEARQERIIGAYSGLVNLLLNILAAQLPPDSIAITHLKLVQTCLAPPMCDAELNLLKSSVEQATEILKQTLLVDTERLDSTLAPILKRVLGETDDIIQQFSQTKIDPTPAPAAIEDADEFASAEDEPDDFTHAHDANLFEAATDLGEDPMNYEKFVQSQNTLERVWRTETTKPFSYNNDVSLDNTAAHETSNLHSAYSSNDTSINNNQANETKPLKAPKAVLKMLRFPEDYKALEAEQQKHEQQNTNNLPESTSETEGIVGDPYPTYDESERDDVSKVAELDDQSAESLSDTELQQLAMANSSDDEMERLHRDFVRQMRAIVAENAEFGVHLGLEIDALDDATKIQYVEDRRKAILASMKKLSESHTELAKKFDSAQNYLSIIESDKRKLSDELDRARMLSLTDELTGLPNRRAFIKRMDDEVSRVKRYGFPLSLVLIDIDHFKQVNDKFGHAAGDVVLKVYAEKILSIFRNHDMIARYGGEEFAVLLPNTDLDGVLRALDKVKSAVPNIECSFNGMTIQAPTFSAGVTEYRPPESPTRFVERADHALYRSKRLGRNRIEVEQKDHEHGVVDNNS